MARFLHLLKRDSPPMAAAVVEQNRREPGAAVTVVLLEEAIEAPKGVTVKTLGSDLDYGQLLELIFESDHVVTW
jgi:hypothetical protein